MRILAKFSAIAAVMAGCLILLFIVKGILDSDRIIHKTIFFEDLDGWGRWDFVGCRLDSAGEHVVFESDGSRLSSPIISAGFSFDDIMLSWNAEELPENSELNFEVSVSPDSSDWHDFHYQTYGSIYFDDWDGYEKPPSKIENIGRVATDILNLQKPMKFAKISARAVMPEQPANVRLRRLTVCLASDNASWSEYRKNGSDDSKKGIGTVHLAVPHYAQRLLPSEIAGSGCSPTSVTMVLNYHEKNVDLEKFSRAVYDPYNDMYGNWPYNVQAAYLAGLRKTWVEIHSGFDELYEEVESGRPAVISIAFGYDELPNSPIHEAGVGHLIAVVGFDGPDTVICNDPAGRSPESGIIRYPRKELEKVWIDHGGIAYHLWP